MKNKFIVWLILLLVIANLATIAIFWLGRGPNRQRPPGNGPAEYIIRELKFNAEQQKKYMELVSAHRKTAEEYHKDIKEAKDSLFNLLGDSSLNDSTKNNALRAISGQTEKLDLLTFEHFREVRALCSEEQKKKFDNIIKEVLEMMGKPRPGGGGRPPMDGRVLR